MRRFKLLILLITSANPNYGKYGFTRNSGTRPHFGVDYSGSVGDADYNGDGLPDVMLGDEVRDKNRNFLYTNWYFYHNTGTTLEPDPNKSGMRLHNRIAKAEGVVVDINGDGCQDLVIPSNDQMLVFSMPGASKRSLVHTIADGEGRNIKFEYDYYKVYDQSQTEKPIRNLKHPICVVSQMTDAHGELLTFDYSGGKVHESKGFLGFERVTARNVTQDKESIMESRLDLVSNTMIPQVQKERRSARVVKESTTKSRVMAIDSHRKRYQILTDTLTQVDHLLGVTHTTIYSYDGQANPVKSVSSNGVTSTVVETSYIKASYGAYSYLPVSITTTLKRSDASDITTRTTYTYNDKGQPTQRVEYEGTGMSVTSLYSYHDKTGVVIEEKIIPTGSSPHTTTYGYDACGRLSRKRLPNASTTTYSITKDNSHGAYYKKQSLEESTYRIDLL